MWCCPPLTRWANNLNTALSGVAVGMAVCHHLSVNADFYARLITASSYCATITH